MSRESGMMWGITIGIIVGLIIVVFLLRWFNRDRNLKTEYDERQQQIRGQAYKIAFYALVIFEAFIGILSIGIDLPAEPFVLHILAIFFGITVQVCYCVWNGAYVGLNTNMHRFVPLMIVISLFNFFVFVMRWRDGGVFENGKLQEPVINLLCALMFAVIGIVGLIRKLADREVEA